MTRGTYYWRIREIRKLLAISEDLAQGTNNTATYEQLTLVASQLRDLQHAVYNEGLEA